MASHAADQRIDLERPHPEPRSEAFEGWFEALPPEVEEEWSGPVVPVPLLIESFIEQLFKLGFEDPGPQVAGDVELRIDIVQVEFRRKLRRAGRRPAEGG